jgi:diguanylate cyclase (GGDEF)-like protein
MREKGISRIFRRVPRQYIEIFKEDSTEKNLRRFSMLPFFNIVTQIACVFIYLSVYPAVLPDRPVISPRQFLLFTAGYLLINAIAAVFINALRRNKRVPNRQKLAQHTVDIFLLCYVILEASQMILELQVSGNIYRFLATFFVISFFPIVGRIKRLGFMGLYILISEGALFYIEGEGMPVYSFPEINLVVFAVCAVAANIYYNGVIDNFVLHQDLKEKNARMETLNNQLRALSAQDALTGLPNRRRFNEYAKKCWQTAKRVHQPIGFLMVDIDYFKNYNDAYGHQQGDACLVQVAQCIKAQCRRTTDMCARYGGEEFVLILPYTSPEGVRQVAQTLCQCVEELQIAHDHNPPYGHVTVSVGASFQEPPIEMENHEALLKMADDAMYEAKAFGRNRVQFAAAEK